MHGLMWEIITGKAKKLMTAMVITTAGIPNLQSDPYRVYTHTITKDAKRAPMLIEK